MTTPLNVSFITYTKGVLQFVTTPRFETEFLDWLNSVDNSAGYARTTCSQVGIRCSPHQVHAVAKKEATILRLVGKENAE